MHWDFHKTIENFVHLDNGITSLSGPCFYNSKIYQKAISTFYIQLIQVIHNINLYIHCKTVEYIQASSLQILYRTTLNMKIEKINFKERNSNFQIPAKYKTSNSSGWCSSSKILQLSTFSRLY